ncbi:MAG: ferredoxin family protein [Candidatus Omnitrophica bacterium]|nr:ferredoxin family protein [Candidatus Omnitrophota bacterium]
MAYVITDKCLGERYATCVASCPVECIHPGEYQGQVFMVIHPETCIDCGACLPECPIGAIVENTDQSPDWAKVNAELASTWKDNPPVPERPRNDPPKKPTNKLV